MMDSEVDSEMREADGLFGGQLPQQKAWENSHGIKTLEFPSQGDLSVSIY